MTQVVCFEIRDTFLCTLAPLRVLCFNTRRSQFPLAGLWFPISLCLLTDQSETSDTKVWRAHEGTRTITGRGFKAMNSSFTSRLRDVLHWAFSLWSKWKLWNNKPIFNMLNAEYLYEHRLFLCIWRQNLVCSYSQNQRSVGGVTLLQKQTWFCSRHTAAMCRTVTCRLCKL